VSFILHAHGLELRIALEALAKIHIHEETIPEAVEALAKEIGKEGVVRHPVIVDARTLVTLDGMHRVAALRKLGCDFLPVCLVDYRNPGIRVGCWYRMVYGRTSVKKLLDVIKLLGMEVKKASSADAKKALDARVAAAAIFSVGSYYILKAAARGVKDAYTWVGHIEKALAMGNLRIGYENERDAVKKVRSGAAIAAVMTPAIKKEEILAAALSDSPFVPKTTRHVMPARPMCVDIPLEWLKGNRPIKECNRILVEQLKRRELQRLPPGSTFERRRYDEELLVFK